MTKLNMNNIVGGKNSLDKDAPQGDFNRILTVIHTGMMLLHELSSVGNTVNSTLSSRKTIDTDNALKLSKAETDVKKEENRHSEEMAKIDLEWQKISNEAVDRERRISFIQEQVQIFQAEYDRYMAMDNETFLSDRVTSNLESLRKVILDLSKELIRS